MASLRLIACCLLALTVLSSSAPVFAVEDSGAEAAGAGEHPAGPPLKPQGEHGEGTDLVIFSIVAFVLFLVALKFLAWEPLIKGLDSREANLREQAAETQHALEKAQSLLKEHEAQVAAAQDEVKEIIAEARRDAERTGQDIVAAAQAEAEAARARAVEDVNRAKDVAIQELFDVMSGQVAGATEHVLGRALSDDDQNRLIDEALKQVATS